MLHLRERLWRSFHDVCKKHCLLEDGDRVLVGLSGGKDSLLLVELLGRQARIYVPKIKVTAVHIRVKERNYQSDTSYLERFCNNAGVEYIVRDTCIAGEEKKDTCFLCSWYRRKALLETARETGCNKIALGHNQDDVLHTLLLNMIYEGRFDTISPALALDKMPITLIRPLWSIKELDIQQYALFSGYALPPKLCPFEKHSKRNEMKPLLEQIAQLNPNVRSSLLHALQRKK